MGYKNKNIVLVGLMGSGKTRVGKALSKELQLNFIDVDQEIESAAGMMIPDIFEKLGEKAFREGERKVVLRLLSEGPHVIATGGGTFIYEDIRNAIKEQALSVWLKTDMDLMIERVTRNNHRRPLLQNVDIKEKMLQLAQERDPIYAEADISVNVTDEPARVVAQRIQERLKDL